MRDSSNPVTKKNKKMKKTKLVFVINELSFFFSHRLSLAKAAQLAGYEIHVVSPKSELIKALMPHGFYFHPIPLNRKGLNPFCEIKSLYSLYRLYRALKPSIVHHLTIKPILYGGLAARLAKVPAVVNAVTGLGYVFISQKHSTKLLRCFSKIGFYLSFRHPNMCVIFQNPDDQHQFIQNRLLKSESALLIKGSGVPLEEYPILSNPETSDEIVVLLPARLLWDKGVGEFVEATKLLREKIKIRMALAGQIDQDNPSAISKEQLDHWIQEGLVEYWGFERHIQEAFARCHIVCLPSYREGMPRVLIEAAACGRPIVTTDVPGCRDIVMNGENGLLVKAKNAQALADGIAKLATDTNLRQQMGKRGRQIVETGFSSSIVNKKTLAVYKSLIDIDTDILT